MLDCCDREEKKSREQKGESFTLVKIGVKFTFKIGRIITPLNFYLSLINQSSILILFYQLKSSPSPAFNLRQR